MTASAFSGSEVGGSADPAGSGDGVAASAIGEDGGAPPDVHAANSPTMHANTAIRQSTGTCPEMDMNQCGARRVEKTTTAFWGCEGTSDHHGTPDDIGRPGSIRTPPRRVRIAFPARERERAP